MLGKSLCSARAQQLLRDLRACVMTSRAVMSIGGSACSALSSHCSIADASDDTAGAR
ncbi:hypothetical protein XHC_0185 [Xanthomonas hortorum pv. carotae str. M081]|nr:hypothetical protein XHC_0185 [Xanthomonas hortorum pv. carotae str. M081]